MNLGASLANLLWLARARRADAHFARALAQPREAQAAWLRAQLARHAASEFGQGHDFAGLHSPAEYAARVPLSTYDDVAPMIARIRRGARNVLAVGHVTHLAPTSGTSGARKLIPFTRSLQEGFDAALSPWITDLARQRPALRWGPAYWSVSPLADEGPSAAGVSTDTVTSTVADAAAESADKVPTTFADDADYLGGPAAWLVRQALAVPADLRFERDIAAFWHRTRLALLRARDLRLISVWHPSFLDLITNVSGDDWERLLDALTGARATELRAVGRHDWPQWWPHLQVISAWGEQAAAAGFQRIAAQAPAALVQAKGLLATEAAVTLPYRGATPLAVTSHYFEFLAESGDILGAHALERGRTYEVLVTNGGGLWRYRLGDVVECTGHLLATPTLRFLGRAGVNSDLRGEKLSEAFVACVLGDLFAAAAMPAYLALRAWDCTDFAGYELLVSSDAESTDSLARRLDAALSANPHYAYARRLGQLAPPRVVVVGEDQARTDLAAQRGRLGDAKPQLLIPAR
jgi:hypothetical protein